MGRPKKVIPEDMIKKYEALLAKFDSLSASVSKEHDEAVARIVSSEGKKYDELVKKYNELVKLYDDLFAKMNESNRGQDAWIKSLRRQRFALLKYISLTVEEERHER